MTDDNQAQIEYWNSEAGETWVRAQERMDAMLAPLSRQAVERAAVRPGEQVMDVGCGCGDTTLALASCGASVLGVDISAPMLARARERAAGLENVAFLEADASTETFEPRHQLVFSRFGVMFFADPVAAFSNLRAALTEDGRLLFLCWQAPAVNPWISVSAQALQPFLDETPPADPREPGPFAFADAQYVQDILQQAGFAGVAVESATADLQLGGGLEEAMRFAAEIGPMSRVLAELDDDARRAALDAVRQALSGHMTANGLCLGASAWLVSARKR